MFCGEDEHVRRDVDEISDLEAASCVQEHAGIDVAVRPDYEPPARPDSNSPLDRNLLTDLCPHDGSQPPHTQPMAWQGKDEIGHHEEAIKGEYVPALPKPLGYGPE